MNGRDWDAVAARFEKEIFNVPANDRKGLIATAVKRHAKQDGIAADIGCGVGRTVGLLAAHFGKVIASDVSTECLSIAVRRNKALRNVSYHQVDLIAERPPGPAADLALCINTLLIADETARTRMFAHVCAAVRPGGVLVLVAPSMESVLLTHARHSEWKQRAKGKARPPGSMNSDGDAVLHGVVCIDDVPTKHYSSDELTSSLAMHEFRTVEVEKLEYPWSTEFDRPPSWMGAPHPWDWFVVARA